MLESVDGDDARARAHPGRDQDPDGVAAVQRLDAVSWPLCSRVFFDQPGDDVADVDDAAGIVLLVIWVMLNVLGIFTLRAFSTSISRGGPWRCFHRNLSRRLVCLPVRAVVLRRAKPTEVRVRALGEQQRMVVEQGPFTQRVAFPVVDRIVNFLIAILPTR